MESMDNLSNKLGVHAAVYEAIAFKVVDVIEAANAPLEVCMIGLKLAQLILDTQERDAWDTALDNVALQAVL